ncbi:MAG: hypothetical protein WD904_06905 [Dehalococcoidia bacterium]
MRVFSHFGFAAFLIVFGIMVGTFVSASASSSDPRKGDMNCDESVNPVDSLLILRHDGGLNVNLPAGCAIIGSLLDGSVPTGSPTPISTPQPTAAPTPTPVSGVTFSDGTWLVTEDIPAGLWRNSDSSDFCYWARLSGLGGELADIIANDFSSIIQTVEIKSSDTAFEADRCGTWSQTLQPPSSGPTQPFGKGTWLVGEEIAPGTWRNSDSSDDCYWERLSAFTGKLADIIANEFDDTIQTVEIKSTDVGFSSNRCGTWTRIGN